MALFKATEQFDSQKVDHQTKSFQGDDDVGIFLFVSSQRITQTLFLFLGSWGARRVVASAQSQSKLYEPRGLSVKGSSFFTKNGHCLLLALGSPPGSSLALSQPAAAGAQDLVLRARLGLTGDGSWWGTSLLRAGSFSLCGYYNGMEKSCLHAPSSSAGAGGLGPSFTNLHQPTSMPSASLCQQQDAH